MNANTDKLLPSGFEELQKYVGVWDLDTTQARWNLRATSSMVEISAFYEDMLRFADRAMAYLEGFPLNQLPPEAGRLLKLLLALANCSMAVEIHGQPAAQFSPMPHGVVVLAGAVPYG